MNTNPTRSRWRSSAALLAVLLTGLAGCTGISASTTSAPELPALRAAGYRIAVLPFAVTAPEDGFLGESLTPVGELLALEAHRELPMRDRLGALVHDDAVAWLRHSDFQVLEPWHVLTTLDHTGQLPNGRLDAAQLQAIARTVGADGVLHGEVRRWNRDYYVLQSVVEVALHVELLDAATGRTLFASDRTETVGSGLTGGPTGYVSAATEPIAGLRSSTLRSLTRSVTRHAVVDLNGGELGAEPDATSPRLALVALAKDHDGPFRVGERVDVIAVGSPDCEVVFDLGALRTVVPMHQTSRDDGPQGARATYLGHYVVQASDRAEELPVTCTIQRGKARRTVAVRYRWEGTVSLAGERPGEATERATRAD